MKVRSTWREVHCGRTKASPVDDVDVRARNSRESARESFARVRFAERTFGVAAVSAITNYAEGMSDTPVSHEQTLRDAARGAADLVPLIARFVSR